MRIIRACILALAVSAGTAATLWKIDQHFAQRTLFEKLELETRAAKALVSNHSIVFPSRINQSVLRWSMAEQLETKPELVLFGSSHGLQVSAENIGGRRLINMSISGAGLADHLITTEILVRRERRPRVWLVMVDAWLFNPDIDFQTWQARPREIVRIETTLSNLDEPPLTPIFSPRVDFFLNGNQKSQYSLDPLFHGFDRFARKYFDHVVIPDHDFQATLMAPDGSLQPPDNEKITPEAVRSLALRQFRSSGDRHRYGNYSKVDDGLWRLFERWVQLLQKDGGRVFFVLPPYHPAIYPQITSNPQNQLNAIETRVWEAANHLEVPVIGSYDPAIVGVNDEDFYDGDHLRDSGLTHLFEEALSEITYGL